MKLLFDNGSALPEPVALVSEIRHAIMDARMQGKDPVKVLLTRSEYKAMHLVMFSDPFTIFGVPVMIDRRRSRAERRNTYGRRDSRGGRGDVA